MADSKKVLEGENLELYCDVEGNGLTDGFIHGPEFTGPWTELRPVWVSVSKVIQNQ